MIGPLIVLVAHGLDGLTLLMAVELHPFEGNEYGPGAQIAFAAAGLGGVLLMKAGGAALLAAIVARTRSFRTTTLLFASAAGLVGAVVNLSALTLFR